MIHNMGESQVVLLAYRERNQYGKKLIGDKGINSLACLLTLLSWMDETGLEQCGREAGAGTSDMCTALF